jgi:hypothetical protein
MTKVRHTATTENLIGPFRVSVQCRRQLLDAGLWDNLGAIATPTRVLDVLSLRLMYPHLSHLNDSKRDPGADRSVAADKARKNDEIHRIRIEHVAPQRAYTRAACDLIEAGGSDKELFAFIRGHFRLVLLTADEMLQLNRRNRSRMDRHRLDGIELVGS